MFNFNIDLGGVVVFIQDYSYRYNQELGIVWFIIIVWRIARYYKVGIKEILIIQSYFLSSWVIVYLGVFVEYFIYIVS